jgi:hypothetical protein
MAGALAVTGAAETFRNAIPLLLACPSRGSFSELFGGPALLLFAQGIGNPGAWILDTKPK